MAHCSVLEAHQKLTDRPSKRIKRSGGHSLVRQLKADWIIVHVLLKMRPESTPAANSNLPRRTVLICKPFIPEKLPSHKTPGTKAIGPVVERSRTGVFRIMEANHLAKMVEL